MNTLALDPLSWDLTVSASGDIAVFSDQPPNPIGLAQDAASAIRLFAGELWFDTTQGVPYFSEILAKRPPIALMKARFVAAARTVPGVVSAICYIATISNRKVTGQVQITDANGNTATAAF